MDKMDAHHTISVAMLRIACGSWTLGPDDPD